jgi:acetyl esterase/lipase
VSAFGQTEPGRRDILEVRCIERREAPVLALRAIDEGLAYAGKLRTAGVVVDLEIYRGVTHEFIKMGRAIPEARQAHADAARALSRTLNQ